MLKRLLPLLLFVAPVFGQVSPNLDTTASSWLTCVEPACNPGGNQAGPSAFSVLNKKATSKDGTSLYLSVTGPDYTNLLAYKNVGQTSANYFYLDLWVYTTAASVASAQALEFDTFAYNSPYRWMFGTQCVYGGNWWGWNDFTGTWIDAGIPCSLPVGRWHHIQEWSHRSPAGQTPCSGMPCSYQDVLAVDGVFYNLNIVSEASWLPAGWANTSGVNLQLDLNASGGSVWAWYDGILLAEEGQ